MAALHSFRARLQWSEGDLTMARSDARAAAFPCARSLWQPAAGRRVRWSLVAVGLCLVSLGVARAAPRTVVPQVRPGATVSIESVTVVEPSDPAQVPRYSKVELLVELSNVAATHFYDPDPVTGGLDLRAVFTDAVGTDWNVNGFYDGADWRIRFAPDRLGSWRYAVTAEDASGVSNPVEGEFTCVPSAHHGWARIESHFLRFADGHVLLAVGHNTGWQPDVEQPALAAMAAAGENLLSFWIAMPWAQPSWASPSEPYWDDRAPIENSEQGIGNYNQAACAYLDGVVARAEAAGVCLLPTIWSHGQLRAAGHPWGEGWWYNNAYNAVCSAAEFFNTADTSQWRYQRNFYRYLIARWGYSRAIAGWVALCEIEGTTGYNVNPTQATAWCAAVRDYFRAHDVFRPSAAGYSPVAVTKVDQPAWEGGLDLRAADSYAQQFNDVEVAATIGAQTGTMWASAKPCFHAEFGGDTLHGATQPRHLHNGTWAGVTGGAALTPLVWCDGGNFPMLTPEMQAHLGYLSEFIGAVGYAGSSSLAPASLSLDTPACRAWGMTRGDRGFAWVQDTGGNVGGETLTVSGLAPGGCSVAWYDVWASGSSPVQTGSGTAGGDGKLSLVLPSLARADVACAFVRTSASDHLLSVESDPVVDVQITGTRPGTTPYTTACTAGESVSLTAPLRVAGQHFLRWMLGGVDQLPAQSAITFDVSVDTTAVAHYGPSPPIPSGVCYGPYTRAGQAPWADEPTEAQISQELAAIGAHFTPLLGGPPAVRTYGVSGVLYEIPRLAADFGLRSAPGVWLGSNPAANQEQVDRLIQLIQEQSDHIEFAVIGNETDCSGCGNAELVGYLAQVRTIAGPLGIPVTSAQKDGFWLDVGNSAVADAVDFVMVNIHPFWAGAGIQDAQQNLADRYEAAAAAGAPKLAIVGEVGWPSEGDANGSGLPSHANQQAMVQAAVGWSQAEGVPTYLFEAFDEPWKDEPGGVGPHWGLVHYMVAASVVGSGEVTGGGQYDAWRTATLCATPAPGHQFEGWSGDLTGQDNPADLFVDSDKDVTAHFRPSAVEQGTVWAGHEWVTVSLTQPFTDPVVVAGPATSKGWQPGVVRLRKVTPTSFQIRFQEWDYLDGWHCAELIHWIAVERGICDLGGGKKLIADRFVTNKTNVFFPKWVAFPEVFSETPVVLTQVQTCNGSDAVTDRICGVYPGGMHFTMQEQESKTDGHCNETVGYIAVSVGTTDLLGVACEVKRTATVVTHNPYTLTGSQGQCKVRVREEQSKDAETLHWPAEKVGFISLAGQPPLVADMQTCNGKDPCELRCTLLSALARRALGVESADDQWRAVPYEEPARVPDVEPWEAAGPCTLLVRAERGGAAKLRAVQVAVGDTVAETLPLAHACTPGDTVTLSAPLSVGDGAGVLAFSHWEVDGQPAELGQATIQVEMTGDREAVAFYVSGN